MHDDSKQTAKEKLVIDLGPKKALFIEAGPEGLMLISVL